MSAINLAAQRALTEKRGKELDRWIEMKCIRFMSGIKPFSPTLSELPTEILHHIVEKMEPVDILSSREVCRSIRNVVNDFSIRYGGMTLFLRNNTVPKRTSPTFTGMPTKIINQVVEKMEPMDRLISSKVCRSLKTAVDTIGTCFNNVVLRLYESELDLMLDGIEISYTLECNYISHFFRRGRKTLIEEKNFVERAANDFKIVSKHARKLSIWKHTENVPIISIWKFPAVTTFVEFFKIEKCIKVKEIKLHNFFFDEFLTILSCFDVKQLKKIELLSCIASVDRFERITHLEQWESAEVCTITGVDCAIASAMIAHFFHFKCFTIYYLTEFPEQTAIQLRDDLLKRSTFQSCLIYFGKSKSNPIEIAKVFKPDYAGGNDFKIEFSNCNNKFDISLVNWFSLYYQLNVKKL